MKTLFPHAYVLNVLSDDHPGIIAAVGEAVSRLGGNIDACSQTVLEGYFTLIMIVSLPQPAEPDLLVGEVQGKRKAGGLQVIARPFAPAPYEGRKGEVHRFVLTSFGADRPGIIRRISRLLAGKDINIADFYWQRTGEDFVLIAQLEIPTPVDVPLLQADLEQLGKEEGFTIRLQHENLFVATNQLRLTAELGKTAEQWRMPHAE